MFWTAPCLCGILQQIPKDREVATAMPNEMPIQTTATRETFLRAAVAAYNLAPGSLWTESPNHLVLRRPDNRKWFAWIMDLPRATLGLSGEGRADLPDFKCADPLLRDLLRSRAGYLPAYHMNRAGWIGLLLDGSLPLEEVLALLQKSYEAAGSKAARRIADGPRTVPHCLAHALREDG